MLRACRAMVSKLPQNPLIAVIGATGTGKSQLAVELAIRFNGEIINGDAVQMYHGLPIITNKITEPEMKGIPHHFLGTIGLDEPTWTVGTFLKKVLPLIDAIHARNRLPILVGGTHYYTQALLVKNSTIEPSSDAEEGDPRTESPFSILDAPTETVLQRLREVDPVMAERWHPHDRRKIQRSLEIFLRTGRPASEMYAAQHAAPDDAGSGDEETDLAGGGMRFPTLTLWVHAPHNVLAPRLDARVHKMLEAGLLDEVRAMDAYRTDKSRIEPVDLTKGIWASIGYRQFAPMLEAERAGAAEAEVLKGYNEGIEMTQAATRRYAKRQIRWVRIKLVNALERAGAKGNLFALDGEDVGRFEEGVVKPAVGLVGTFLEGGELPAPEVVADVAGEILEAQAEDLSLRRDLWVKKRCEVCGTTAVTEHEWEKHVRSKRHGKLVAKAKKREGDRERLALREEGNHRSEVDDSQEG
ncbi:tRNA isopentenyltransferase [Trichodelitschia bisporula]|uniref:tRNA dimethylallyltransferase n=1 Tax=Trichodelitschia bisporula TaxID=703511 RepID=A0A6G1HPF2_9PEZI|nr:tRNA isopentenyltransferase [Trichodelitschia bisporula]